MNLSDNLKIGFIGCGNISEAIIRGWVESGTIKASHIFASNRSEAKLQKVVDAYGIKGVSTEELIEEVDVVVLGMKPQDLAPAIEPLESLFDPEQIIISLAAGIPIASLQKTLSTSKKIIRIMPNTPIRLRKGVIGYCFSYDAQHLDGLVEDLFSPLGLVVAAEEGESFEAITVSSSAGVGFVFEIMQYWKEWLEEHGFESGEAQAMTVQTFLGAADLATQEPNVSILEHQARVTSKKGVTWAGLDSMRELEVERALRYSFEKAVLRDRELGKSK